MNVADILNESLSTAADRAAFVSGIGKSRREISYAELADSVDALVREFRLRGLKPGDRVFLAIPVSIETYVAMLAILKAGLVVMFIDPAHGPAEIARCLKLNPPAAIMSTRAVLLLRFLSPELRRIPIRFVTAAFNDGPRAGLRSERRSSEDSALLTFTSGSTGEPKPVIRTHGFMRRQLEILDRVANPQAGDIDFVAMPMFALFNLAHGVTSVIPAADMKRPGRANPRILLAQLRAENATSIVASPALLERLVDHCLKKRQTFPALRCISTGGGPVSPTLPERLAAIAPNAEIRTVYGSTEAEPIASVTDDAVSIADRRAMRVGAGLLVGRPVEGCNVKIIPSRNGFALGPFTETEFRTLALPQGEIGEIVVSGRHVLPGYADPSGNRETKIEVGGRRWHRTGDAGYLDNKGRLWLVGRCAAAISDSRGVVYPFQVEYAVSAVRGISRAALIAEQGRRVLVLETAAREFTSDCIKAARCVADKQIDRIITVRHIPVDRRHDAKVDYPALKRLLENRTTRLRFLVVAMVTRLYRIIRDRVAELRCFIQANG